MTVYASSNGSPVSTKGLLYGHPKQLLIQLLAALTIIVWDGVVTFILLKIIGLVTRGLRIPDDELQAGDVDVHEEEAYPDDDVFSPALAGVGAGGGGSLTGPSGPAPAPDSGTLAGDAR
jgi:Amt family ammonium transporter